MTTATMMTMAVMNIFSAHIHESLRGGEGGQNAGGGSEPHPKAQCGLAYYCAGGLAFLPHGKLKERSEAHEMDPLR